MAHLIPVERVFLLARMSPSPEEVEVFASQLDAVLEYMNSLDAVDTEGVEPPGNVTGEANVFRDDVPGGSLPLEEVLKNAPSRDGASFGVPKVF